MRLEISDKDIELFQSLVCKKSGIYLEGSRLDSLRAGLCAEMESKGFASYSQYYNFLRFHPDGQKGLEELLSHITINETHFFRNVAHFEALRDLLLVKLIKENKDGAIRIWSAGCSTGEEPYSIAMIVLDLFQEYVVSASGLQIEILATDVDRQALAKAEAGIYGKRALRTTEEKYRDRYLSGSNGKFEVDRRLRDMVQFKYFNLIETPYPKPSLGNWDIIFCRNVVIYFNRESVRLVASGFHSVLADEGYLFMGHSETLDGISDEFSLVEMCGTFVYVKKPHSAVKEINEPYAKRPLHVVPQKSGSSSKSRAVKKANAPASATKNTKKGLDSRGIRPEKALSSKPYALNSDAESIYIEASEMFAREHEAFAKDAALSKIEMYIELKPEDARGHLLAGKIYADRGIYERAVSEFEKAIELEPLLMEAHYLLGVTYQNLGQTPKAIDEFKKSVYIDKDCVLPYFRLACIHQSNSMKSDALREFNNAVRILKKLQGDEVIQFSGGLTARLLTQICLKNIEELSG